MKGMRVYCAAILVSAACGCAREVPSEPVRAAASGSVVAANGSGTGTGTGTGTWERERERESERPDARAGVVRVEAGVDADVASFIRVARARANKAGKVVLVEVGAGWC